MKYLALVFILAAFGCAPHNATNCEEDQPCWNCATMGNHICGK